MLHRLLITCLLGCLCQSSVLMAARPPDAAELEKLKQDIRSARQRIHQSENEKDQLSRALRRTETELASTGKQIHRLNNDIRALQLELASLEQQQQSLQQQKQQQEQVLDEQIATSYRMGREKAIKMLLNQENPQKLSRAMAYAGYFSRARMDALLQYQQLINRIDDNQKNIEDKADKLLDNKQAMLAQQQQLQAMLADRARTLSSINNSIKTDQQKLERLQQEQAQLEALLRSVNEAVANIRLPGDTQPFADVRGKLRWPADGKRDNRYGKKRPPGDFSWEGIAIRGTIGQEIKAVHHGRVVFADWFRGKGLLLIIDHGDGYMSLYAHNQSLLRETGDWVSAGETIATLGNSGGLEQPELYFEIRHQGKPLNPGHWLRRG
ncbi:MAG TPA: peptidoglycan DD-metalloendopeptidase family protein [Pseudomonadales bacterium]